MKKIVALILALVMVVGLVACGNKDDVKEPEANDPVVEAPVDNNNNNNNDNEQPTDEFDPSMMENEEDQNVEIFLSTNEYILLDLFNLCTVEFPVMTWAVDLADDEAIKVYTGLDNFEDIRLAAVTEPVMNSQAYSVVLVQVAEGVDVQATAEAMKAGVNPNKWSGVSADEIEVAVYNDYILLAMMSSELSETVSAKSIVDAWSGMMPEWSAPDKVDDENLINTYNNDREFVEAAEENANAELVDDTDGNVAGAEDAENADTAEDPAE